MLYAVLLVYALCTDVHVSDVLSLDCPYLLFPHIVRVLIACAQERTMHFWAFIIMVFRNGWQGMYKGNSNF